MQTNEYKLPPTLNKKNVTSVLESIDNKLKTSLLEINCDDVMSIDSAGIALITYLTSHDYKLKLVNVNTHILELCQLYHISI